MSLQIDSKRHTVVHRQWINIQRRSNHKYNIKRTKCIINQCTYIISDSSLKEVIGKYVRKCTKQRPGKAPTLMKSYETRPLRLTTS